VVDDARPRRSKRTRVKPVFVVTPARSGSTLLRYLLDSHPDITCPPEFNLSVLMQQVVNTWRQVDNALAGTGEPAAAPNQPFQLPTAEQRRRARKVIDEIMATCAKAKGARVYCDKSLTTVEELPLVASVYPDASYIFLYRFPLDMIASGMEASRWGFAAYGFLPYVAGTPGNFIAGLANYWIDRVSRMLEFERTCTASHARIYYELMCGDPAKTMAEVCSFLGVEPDHGMTERLFTHEHQVGPGDYKIDFTRTVSLDSIGRGATLPPTTLTEPLVQRINDLLAELDYPTVQAAWQGDLAALLGLKVERSEDADSGQIVDGAIVRMLQRLPQLAAIQRDALPFELSVQSGGAEEILLVEATAVTRIAAGTGDPDSAAESRLRLATTREVLVQVTDGRLSIAAAVHDAQVRLDRIGGTGPTTKARRQLATLGALLEPTA
jgi:hypothetical protein